MKTYTSLFCAILSFCIYAQETPVTNDSGIESEIAITINPNNEDQIIISSMSGNGNIVYTSQDGGTNWNESSFTKGLSDPILTYGDNNNAYLAYLDFGSTLEVSLATSLDNGQSWTPQTLTLDGTAVDRPWIKRDNTPSSPYYENIYLAYFHPENNPEIHIVDIDGSGTVGTNHSVQSNSYNYVQNPAMDIAKNGDVVVCFLSQHPDNSFKIMSVSSTDGTNTFSSETIVSDVHMYDASGTPVTDVIGFAPGAASRLQNSLQMAIDKSNGPYQGRVYLSWTDFVENDPAEGMNVYLSYSDDNGATWSQPAIVNDDNVPSSHQYYAAIDVSSNGILALSWYDRRDDPTNDALTDFYFAISQDGGDTFHPSVKVNSVSSDHTAVTTGPTTFGVGEYVTLEITQSYVYVTWADGRNNNGDMDVYFAKSDFNILNIEETKLEPTVLLEPISPNPVTNGTLQVELSILKETNVQLNIRGIDGKLLKSIANNDYLASNQNISIPVSNLSAGVYILEVQHGNGRIARRFVIND